MSNRLIPCDWKKRWLQETGRNPNRKYKRRAANPVVWPEPQRSTFMQAWHNYPCRKVVKRRNFKIRYEYNMTGRKYARTVSCKMVELTLECGHKVRRKKSAEPRRQVRCEECYYDQSLG